VSAILNSALFSAFLKEFLPHFLGIAHVRGKDCRLPIWNWRNVASEEYEEIRNFGCDFVGLGVPFAGHGGDL
jgi:hypothetical protein